VKALKERAKRLGTLLPLKQRTITPGMEFLLWALAFVVLRAVLSALWRPGPLYCDEITFIEGALRMGGNGLHSDDYIHGPIIYYVLLLTHAITLLVKMMGGALSGIDDFLRWYVEHPEGLRQAARGAMYIGGGATIAATMYAAHLLSGSRHKARIAGLMLLSMPLFHHSSWFIKEDLWAALFGVLALALAFRRQHLVSVGICLGLAIAAKYTAVVLLPAVFLILADASSSPQVAVKGWIVRCLQLTLAAVITFTILNPYALIHFRTFLEQLHTIENEYLRGDLIGGRTMPPLLADSVIREFIPLDIGIVATVALLYGAARGNWGPLSLKLPLIVGPLAAIALLGICRAGFPRSLTIALPWIAVLASVSWPQWNGSSKLLNALPIVLLVSLAVLQVSGFYRYVAAPDTRELGAAFIEQTIPGDAVILCEGLHNRVPDAGLSLRPNLRCLAESQQEILARGGIGRLSELEKELAASAKPKRFEILAEKDLAPGGMEELERADVVVAAKWLSPFPDDREFNISDSKWPPALDYARDRALFFEALQRHGFRLVRTFAPSLPARWSFIDRPDPRVLYSPRWLESEVAVGGPEISIYVRCGDQLSNDDRSDDKKSGFADLRYASN
jgi:hypothetical protein